MVILQYTDRRFVIYKPAVCCKGLIMPTQKERTEATQTALLATARALFLRHGYETTTTQMVLSETGLSKGALYHHFKSKTDMMEAIYRAESKGAIDRAVSHVGYEPSPLARLRAACLLWLKEVEDDDVSSILFELGPAALGRRRAKEIEDQFSMGLFLGLLKEASAAGEIDLPSPELTARLLNAIMAEASIYARQTGEDSTETVAKALDSVLGR